MKKLVLILTILVSANSVYAGEPCPKKDTLGGIDYEVETCIVIK